MGKSICHQQLCNPISLSNYHLRCGLKKNMKFKVMSKNSNQGLPTLFYLGVPILICLCKLQRKLLIEKDWLDLN